MPESQINTTLETIGGLVDDYYQSTGAILSSSNERLNEIGVEYRTRVDHSIAAIETGLAAHISTLYLSAEAHTLSAYYHASPGLIAILTAIWGGVKTVWGFVQKVVNVINILQQLHINDLLKLLIPQWDQFCSEIYSKLGEYGEALGWGIDAMSTLFGVANSGINIYGAMAGKDEGWFEMKFMDNTQLWLQRLNIGVTDFTQDPGMILGWLCQDCQEGTMGETFGWWLKNQSKIDNAFARVGIIGDELGNITGSLAGLQAGMPELVRKNIPQAIWDALERADNYVNYVILPAFAKINSTISEISAQVQKQSETLSRLAGQLSMPGSVLKGVDALPGVLKTAQEDLIDDVSSRAANREADAILASIDEDLNTFDLITEAMKAPTPEPVFLGIETPERKKATGIHVEPEETWFVGGYESPY